MSPYANLAKPYTIRRNACGDGWILLIRPTLDTRGKTVHTATWAQALTTAQNHANVRRVEYDRFVASLMGFSQATSNHHRYSIPRDLEGAEL